MFRIGAWNIRGLNDPIKQKNIREAIRMNNLSMMGILEVKVKDSHMDAVLKGVLPQNWQALSSFGTNNVARLLVIWDDLALQVTQVQSSNQMITMKVMHNSKVFFCLNGVCKQ